MNKNLSYTISAARSNGFKWDWKHKGNARWGATATINTAVNIARTLSRDPNMKVLILHRIYDIATVFYGVEHSINHIGLTKEIKDIIKIEYYEANHIMYTNKPSMEKFRKDVSPLILSATK